MTPKYFQYKIREIYEKKVRRNSLCFVCRCGHVTLVDIRHLSCWPMGIQTLMNIVVKKSKRGKWKGRELYINDIYIWYSYAWFNETCFITYMKIWCSLLLNPLQPSLWHLWHCLTCLSRCCCGGRCRGDMSQALGISGASKRSKGKCFFCEWLPNPPDKLWWCLFSSPLWWVYVASFCHLFGKSCKLQMSCWRCNWNGWSMWWCCPCELMKQVTCFQELSRPPIC